MPDVNAPEPGQRRVFLSYAQPAEDVARDIAEALRTAGLHVWFAEWELAAGDSIAERIDAGLAASDVLVVLLSPAAVASRWVDQELCAARSREVRDRAIAAVPALIGDCEIPRPLSKRAYLDLRSDREAGIHRLISQLGAATSLHLSQLDPRAFENLIAGPCPGKKVAGASDAGLTTHQAGGVQRPWLSYASSPRGNLT